jgi:glycosyltransferase involved in cell wall biosynthesis
VYFCEVLEVEQKIMKSIQILRRFSFKEWGGTESVVWNCSTKLIEKNNCTKIFATSALDTIGKENVQNVDIERFKYFYPHLNITANNKLVLDKKGGNPYSPQLYKALVSSKDVQILHCHTMQRLANTVRHASKKLNIPYVISFHGGCFNVPESEIKEMLKPLNKTFNYGKFIDIILKNNRFLEDAAGVLCVGYNEYLSTKEKFPDKIVEYLPNGVNIDKFKSQKENDFREKYSIPKDEKIILCVSRIDYQKNQEMLVDLLAVLQGKKEKIHLLLIGPVTSEAYLEKIQSKITLHNLEKNVTIIKGLHTDNPDLVNAYSTADYFILPSVHEPFGIVVLEAWAAKLPVIASKVGGLANLLTDGKSGLFFDNASVGDLAEKYFSLSNNTALKKELVNTAYNTVKSKYSWDIIVDKLLTFYERVITKYKNG